MPDPEIDVHPNVHASVQALARERASRLVPALITNFIGVSLALVLMFLYVDKVNVQSERRNIERAHQICGLIEIIDDITQRQPEPTGPDADGVKRYRIELHRYRLTSCG